MLLQLHTVTGASQPTHTLQTGLCGHTAVTIVSCPPYNVSAEQSACLGKLSAPCSAAAVMVDQLVVLVLEGCMQLVIVS